MIIQRSIRSRIQRECREYERIWKGRYVDKHLADHWLEALNGLSCFNLISICEGHTTVDHHPREYPHINLRMKPECFSLILRDEKNFLQFVRTALVQICHNETTNIRVEYTQKFYNLGSWQNDFVVHFQACLNSAQDVDFSVRSRWFDQVVQNSIQFDRAIKENTAGS